MKKRVSLIILSIVIVFGILVSSTYAIFFRKEKLANSEKYTTGILDIIIDNENEDLGNTITLSNALPMSNEEGMNTTPYRFRLTNNGNLDYTFDLILTKSGTINGNYVKAKVEENDVVRLSSNNAIIATGLSLLAGQSKVIEVRFWLDENTPNSEIGKTLSASLSTTGNGESYDNMVEKIISLSQGESYTQGEGNGVYATNPYNDNGTTKYHEYRYIGGEVDNYVKFNNDMYRIIGVFDDNSHGVTGEYLVKLIRERKLLSSSHGVYNSAPAYTTYVDYKNNWDGLDNNGTTTNGTGVPTNANILLNEFYLNPNSSSTYGTCANWTYFDGNNLHKSSNCSNIGKYGISTNNIRNYIQPVTWYLKGYATGEYGKEDFYNCERSNDTVINNCNSGNSGVYSSTTTAKIGLMYASDYLYASGYVASDDNTIVAGSDYFGASNWLYKGVEWTITPQSNSAVNVFAVSSYGRIYVDNSVYGYGLFPVFYLKKDVKIKSGNGTFSNPYIIG